MKLQVASVNKKFKFTTSVSFKWSSNSLSKSPTSSKTPFHNPTTTTPSLLQFHSSSPPHDPMIELPKPLLISFRSFAATASFCSSFAGKIANQFPSLPTHCHCFPLSTRGASPTIKSVSLGSSNVEFFVSPKQQHVCVVIWTFFIFIVSSSAASTFCRPQSPAEIDHHQHTRRERMRVS